MRFAVFIDRDGTINQEAGYVDSIDRFRIMPRVPDAIRILNENNIPAIMVTNQSGIGRGYFSLEFLEELHNKMTLELKKENSRLDGIYLCPHTPSDRCVCRKPKPGLLLKAANDKGISLHDSYVIGDKITDIQLAHSVGARGILVLTGYGSEVIRTISDDKPDHVASNLYSAVEWIVEQQKSPNIPPLEKGGKGGFESRILIVKPSSLGDIIHSLPVLWALRKSQPDAFIGWVVKDVWKDILTENPLLDEIILLKKGLQGFLSAVKEIRRGRYGTIIDLQGLFRSGILSYLSGGRGRIGFENARESAPLFYNKKIPLPLHVKRIHAVDRYLMTVNSTHALPRFPLYINMEDSEWARDFLIKNDLKDVSPLIAINPSARWLKKRWPANLYAALINRLIQELKAGIIILGSIEDIPVAEDISSIADSKAAIAAGKTSLKTLTALLERVDILITNDSGPMHIAAALGSPVVALFGPTDPGLTGPYGNNHTVIRKDMECSPCFRKTCIHSRPLCMESITVDEVIKAVKDILLKQ